MPSTVSLPAGTYQDRAVPGRRVLQEVGRARGGLVDEAGTDVVARARLDSVALAATCYALPGYARELGPVGAPRLWPWPEVVEFRDRKRREELLVAAGLVVGAVERLNGTLGSGAGFEVGTAGVLAQIELVMTSIAGPRPGDAELGAGDTDAIAFAAACYALPPWARQVRSVPLLWPWPTAMYLPGQTHREDLLMAGGLLVVEIQRRDRLSCRSKPSLSLVRGGAR